MVASNPQSATSRFVLVYHYLTEGFNDAAAVQLKQVVALRPTTRSPRSSSSRWAGRPPDGRPEQPPPPAAAGRRAATAMPAPINAAPINTTVPEGATITGTWSAKPDADTTISLTIEPAGHSTGT